MNKEHIQNTTLQSSKTAFCHLKKSFFILLSHLIYQKNNKKTPTNISCQAHGVFLRTCVYITHCACYIAPVKGKITWQSRMALATGKKWGAVICCVCGCIHASMQNKNQWTHTTNQFIRIVWGECLCVCVFSSCRFIEQLHGASFRCS